MRLSVKCTLSELYSFYFSCQVDINIIDLQQLHYLVSLFVENAALLAAAKRTMYALSPGFFSVALIASATILSTPFVIYS